MCSLTSTQQTSSFRSCCFDPANVFIVQACYDFITTYMHLFDDFFLLLLISIPSMASNLQRKL